MPDDDQPRPSFDERKAAEELEKLKLDVEKSRQRRKEASAAFDSFVASFGREPEHSERPALESRQLSPRYDAPPITPRHTSQRRPVTGLVVGGVLVIAAMLLLARVWRGAPEDTASPPAAAQPEAPAAPAEPATGTGGEPAPVAAEPVSGLQVELVAADTVWVRATADGVRIVEREIAAGERVPVRAERTLVIRAGNAGALRLVVNGEDRGRFGEEGVALTRTYTAPQLP